uniref:Uncharacterized protein n=1 Tax=uncultured Desulfobacterium sp. TaxID=201089 RepID=E1YF51_9BACT|nr:unknown protein [uncultured Desulfobacterium sp.]
MTPFALPKDRGGQARKTSKSGLPETMGIFKRKAEIIWVKRSLKRS